MGVGARQAAPTRRQGVLPRPRQARPGRRPGAQALQRLRDPRLRPRLVVPPGAADQRGGCLPDVAQLGPFLRPPGHPGDVGPADHGTVVGTITCPARAHLRLARQESGPPPRVPEPGCGGAILRRPGIPRALPRGAPAGRAGRHLRRCAGRRGVRRICDVQPHARPTAGRRDRAEPRLPITTATSTCSPGSTVRSSTTSGRRTTTSPSRPVRAHASGHPGPSTSPGWVETWSVFSLSSEATAET